MLPASNEQLSVRNCNSFGKHSQGPNSRLCNNSSSASAQRFLDPSALAQQQGQSCSTVEHCLSWSKLAMIRAGNE